MTGWGYYKILALTGSGAEETDINYKVAVTFNANMNVDFSDIRFTDSDNVTLLEQFRESYVESTSAIFWIKVPSVSAGGKTLRMWYGNLEATLVSDGETVFPLFDDFTGDNGDPPDPTKWAISDNDYVQIDTNRLKAHLAWGHLDQYCRSVSQLSGAHGLRCSMTQEVSGTGTIKVGTVTAGNTLIHYYSNNYSTSRWYCGGSYETASPIVSLVFQVVDIRRLSLLRTLYFYNDVQGWDKTSTSYDDLGVGIEYSGANPSSQSLFDWIFFYKLHSLITDTFPVLGEEQQVVTADFSADDVTPAVGQIVRFTNASTGDTMSYVWDFGDGNTSIEENPHHTYSRVGTFTVVLVTTSGGNEDTETKTDYITVAAAPDDTGVGEMIDDIAFRIQDPHMDGRIDGWNQ